jgi:hypothetical protein
MTAPTCFHPQCNRGLATGHTVYRINAKGQLGIWACEEHRKDTDAPRDPELDRIINILEQRKESAA